jgi:pimeloyl-ACP methyl ester carboxylesterase
MRSHLPNQAVMTAIGGDKLCRRAHMPSRVARAFGRFQFDPERLRALHVPTLLLVGGESTLYNKAATATVANALPNARIVVLPGQQHNAKLHRAQVARD